MKQFYTLLSTVLIGTGAFAQTYYQESFEAGQGAWNFVDHDADGKNWSVTSLQQPHQELGLKVIISHSWSDNTPLTPDNFAVSPAIDLAAAAGQQNVFLSFKLYTSANYPGEKFSVYLTTSNDVNDIKNATPIHTETVQQGGLQSRMVQVPANLLGQTMYLTFRHHDCEDMEALIIDDIKISKLGQNEVQLLSVGADDRAVLVNEGNKVSFVVKNNGASPVTSLKVAWNAGSVNNEADINLPQPLQGGSQVRLEYPNPVVLDQVKLNQVEFKILKVNGVEDNLTDNNGQFSFYTVSQKPESRKVLIEKGTGTWCGWCPRGIYAVEKLSSETAYKDKFVVIDVHANDPMQVSAYVQGAGFAGYPSMNVDRTYKGIGVSYDNLKTIVDTFSPKPLLSVVGVAPTLNGSQLTVKAKATFYTNIPATDKYRFAAVLTEDGVTGTGDNWLQSNYFAQGKQGHNIPNGDWNTKPEKVQMAYNHVARALIGGYSGVANSITGAINDGQTIEFTFPTQNISSYVSHRLSVTVLVINEETGALAGIETVKLSDVLNVETVDKANFTVFPNPAKDVVNVKVENAGEYTVSLTNVSGQTVVSTTENVDANGVLTLSVAGLAKGVYIVNVKGGAQAFTQKLIVE